MKISEFYKTLIEFGLSGWFSRTSMSNSD